jgi:hypothetical protein
MGKHMGSDRRIAPHVAIGNFIRLLEAVRGLETNGHDRRQIQAMLNFIMDNARPIEGLDTQEIESELRKVSLH